jgi:tRNA U34 5-methylaminomethyl-2-thiouridine-forming methyltransferase MnmC
MKNVIKTNDGSNTLYSRGFDEYYHSTFGAIDESNCVYIDAGLNYSELTSIKIFEVGFGTGLNAILTFIEGSKKNIDIEYHTIELFPLDIKTINQLNYFEFITSEQKLVYKILHNSIWNDKNIGKLYFSENKIRF